MTIGVCAATHGRAELVREMAASAQAEGVDEIVVLDAGSDPPVEAIDGINLLRADRNLGSGGGRERVIASSTTDIVLFLDDDAVLLPGARDAVLRAFEADPGLGAVAFRVQRPDGSIDPSEQVLRADQRRGGTVDEQAECAVLIGCAYAIRRAAYDETSGFDASMYYAHDDLDIGMKLIGKGWRILYEPAARAIHNPSPRGRGNPGFVAHQFIRNRCVLARRNLPLPIAAVHSAVWAAVMLRKALSDGVVRDWARGVADGWRTPLQREPYSFRTLVHVHRIGGRVLY